MATEIATDNFNRADGAIGANWSAGHNGAGNIPVILSNGLVNNTNGIDNTAYWSANAFHTDHYSQATITTIGGGGTNYSGVLVRSNSTDAVIGQINGSGGYAIYWYNGATYPQIGSTYSTTPANGDVLRLEADGNTFTLYINGVQRVQGTNTNAPITGSAGISPSNEVGSNKDTMDDWSGGNLYDMGIIAIASSGDGTTANPSFSLTIPDGYTNLLLLVLTQCRDATDADRNITGITWNTSEALTQVREDNDNTYDLTTEIWSLVAPTDNTTANVAATFAGALTARDVVAIVIAGAHQSGNPEASNGAKAATGHPSGSVTTVTNNAIVFDSLFTKDNVAPAVGSGQAEIRSNTVNGGGDGAGVSYERKATAGSTTMSWTQNLTTEQWIMTLAAVKPYTAASSTTKVLVIS